ncbi:hypothetical protein ACFY19_20865 [Streptosporangium saharense]|uniref:hypothetical protein n=1 Tax=Streptosporangium saharense TaxID=1706840 RepID=UPI0036877029
MARDEARVFTSIWRDEQFRAYSANAQRMFLFLLSQPDLTYCGSIALRERKWSGSAAGLTIADVRNGLYELAVDPSANPSANPSGGPFILIDEDTEELLIRSLIRLDGVWRIPNLLLSARRAAALVESPQLRAAILTELQRLPVHESSEHVRAEHALFVQDLGGPAAPPELVALAASRGKGSQKGSRNPSGKGSAKGSGKGSPNPLPKGPRGRGKGEGSAHTSPSRTNTGTSEDDTPHPKTPGAALTTTALPRLDVERLCAHLADRIAAHGVKRPTITQAWRDAARLLLDKDGRTEDQVHTAIEWTHDDEFWHKNVLSMPKLRAKYDQLQLAAKAAAKKAAGKPPTTSKAAGNAAAYEAAMTAAIAAEQAAYGTPDTTTVHHITIAGELES